MTQATTSAVRASLALAAVAIFAALAPRVSFAQATPPAAPATASAFAKIQGYLLDSIPVGTRRLLLLAPLLDTLGVGQMRTPPITFAAGDTHTLDMAIPSAERLVGILCTPAQRMRGPAAMVGFVRDPETKG